MRISLSLFLPLVAVFLSSLPTYSQGQTALTFLSLPPTSEANGMGGTAIALQRSDPTAAVFSPAQIGLSSLSTNVRVGFCPGVTGLLGLPDAKFSAIAASAGVLLNDFAELPLQIGVGVGYHRVGIDYGSFIVTNSSGVDIERVDANEQASGLVIGVGIEYYLRFGFGYTFRSVDSQLSLLGTDPGQTTGTFEGNAKDYGFTVEAPLLAIAEKLTGSDARFGSKLIPFVTFSGGMAWNNIDDRVVYLNPAQVDPFPRTVRGGLAVLGGLTIEEVGGWGLISVAWSREAEDLLVVRNPDGTWEYQSGTGNFDFGVNVIQGKATEDVDLRSGWQIDVAELFTYRQGAAYGSSTEGYTLQLAGLLNALTLVTGGETPEWLLFVRSHCDIQYHSAQTVLQPPQSGRLSYSGLSFGLQGWLL